MINLNNELKESMYTNNLIINITDIDYEKIIELINELKEKYKYEYNIIMESNEKSLEYMNRHCTLVKNIINDVINDFDVVKKYDICIFLSGSFARCSNKKNSDIDLQFAYPQKYKNDIFKYEEMIYYTIATVLNMERSNVHSMLVTRMNRDNMNYFEEQLDDSPLKVTLQSNVGKIEYQYRANTKRRLYLQYCNNNSLEEVFKYLQFEVENNNKEWAHVFYVFSFEKEFSNYYDKLYNYEKSIINMERIEKRKLRINKKIEDITGLLKEIDNDNISDFKMVYQKKEFALLNEYISYKRDISLLNNIDWKYINYFDNQKQLFKDNIFISILNYLFLLFENVESLGKKYSLHSNEIVKIKNYKLLYIAITTINNNILEEVNKR